MCVGLKAAVEDYKKWLVSSMTDEAFAHISDEEKATVRTSCTRPSRGCMRSWRRRLNLPKTDPCFSCQDVTLSARSSSRFASYCEQAKAAPPKPEAEEKKPRKTLLRATRPRDDQAPAGGGWRSLPWQTASPLGHDDARRWHFLSRRRREGGRSRSVHGDLHDD